MKQIDNRQKQQILMRAQKAFLGGKNPVLPKEKVKERIHSATPAGSEKSSSKATNSVEETAPGNVFHRTESKVGRNDPCPCGSGKKYKKCCLNKE